MNCRTCAKSRIASPQNQRAQRAGLTGRAVATSDLPRHAEEPCGAATAGVFAVTAGWTCGACFLTPRSNIFDPLDKLTTGTQIVSRVEHKPSKRQLGLCSGERNPLG